jgi:hypothetical protein
MHGCHRIPCIGQAPLAELGGQLAEPGRQHRAVLSRELPRQPDLGQVAVGILDCHARLPHASQPAQHHDPPPRTVTGRQPGIQVGQQRLPPGQQRRSWR